MAHTWHLSFIVKDSVRVAVFDLKIVGYTVTGLCSENGDHKSAPSQITSSNDKDLTDLV